MRITVKECGGRRFTVALPTGMIFSPTLLTLGLRIGRKYTCDIPNISDRDLRAICREVKRIKRRYGRYELVSVESGDGDLVRIVL